MKEINSIENCDISYKKSISEFDIIYRKVNDIKRTIEEEITKLKCSKNKITVEIISYFKKERLRLIEEENKLKLKLDKNVQEMEIELAQYLKQTDNILSSCEKVLKLAENYEILNDNNKIRTLFCISEINKNNELSKAFITIPFKNLDISFDTIFNTLQFNEYFFSGIPVPKDIKLEKKKIKFSSLGI